MKPRICIIYFLHGQGTGSEGKIRVTGANDVISPKS